VAFVKVFFLYFFTNDLFTKVPPHPESSKTLMHWKSFPFLPPFLLYIHPKVMEDKCLVLGFLDGLKRDAAAVT
jgi:hypothetical protein